jgi:hypothetical protein
VGRGVVHFHAVIRLDAPGDGYQPPPPGITADILAEAIGQAAAAVKLPVTAPGGPVILTFGLPQGTDVRPIRCDDITGTGQPLSRQAVANYIAKYTTKTLSVPGLPSLRLRREADIERLRCPAHYRRMITTAWQLGGRYRGWAHMLGYGGHFLTKSRRYSVTFGQLRQARTDHPMGHGSMRAALIYQHRSTQRDKMIADAISARVSAELPRIGHVTGTKP